MDLTSLVSACWVGTAPRILQWQGLMQPRLVSNSLRSSKMTLNLPFLGSPLLKCWDYKCAKMPGFTFLKSTELFTACHSYSFFSKGSIKFLQTFIVLQRKIRKIHHWIYPIYRDFMVLILVSYKEERKRKEKEWREKEWMKEKECYVHKLVWDWKHC